jgi:hypothetical protein
LTRFLEKQKFNIFRPIPKKKRDYKELWKFAIKCIKIERRSRLSGLLLFSMDEIKKNKFRKELNELLPKKTEGKLNEEQDKRFKWILQVFSLKELTDIIKKFTYEQYKSCKLF